MQKLSNNRILSFLLVNENLPRTHSSPNNFPLPGEGGGPGTGLKLLSYNLQILIYHKQLY